MAEIYKGGMPYGPDVEKLDLKFPRPAEGQVIPHDDFEEVLGMKSGSKRYYAVINSWRKKLRATRDIDTEWDRGVGLKILTPADRLSCGERDFRRSVRATARAVKRTLSTDRDRLDSVGQRRYDHIATRVRPFLEDMRRVRKELSVDLAPVQSLPKPNLEE